MQNERKKERKKLLTDFKFSIKFALCLRNAFSTLPPPSWPYTRNLEELERKRKDQGREETFFDESFLGRALDGWMDGSS